MAEEPQEESQAAPDQPQADYGGVPPEEIRRGRASSQRVNTRRRNARLALRAVVESGDALLQPCTNCATLLEVWRP